MICLLAACTHGSKSVSSAKLHAKKGDPVPSTMETPVEEVVSEEDPENKDDGGCHRLKENIQPPAFVPVGRSGFFITRFLKPCLTRDGERGVEPGSSWMAMGIPCTGGQGKIHLKRPVYAPKLVTFLLSTECAMEPRDLDALKEVAQQRLGLGDAFPLIAYNPLSIQYWELVGFSESDVGDSMYLSSATSRTTAWPKFLANEPIVARIYGRENAWVEGNYFYELNVELHSTGNNTFRLEIVSGKALNNEEIALVKVRCSARSPSINCNEIF